MSTINTDTMKFHAGRLVGTPKKLVSSTHGVSMENTDQQHRHKHKVTLVTGGGRSGKTGFAVALAQSVAPNPLCRSYIATAQPFDDEMRRRIEAHQAQRNGTFVTVEEPIKLAHAIEGLSEETVVAVVDCLTVWLGNLMFHNGADSVQDPQVQALLAILKNPPCDIILVTNETGMGIIPADAQSRTFRDMAGWLNQDIAALADTVVLMVSGIPVVIKGSCPRVSSEERS